MRHGQRPRGERGMVTAELAVGLPAVVLVLALALSALGLAAQQLRCGDAAGAAARVAARGEADDAAVAEALRRAPDGASVQVERRGGEVEVVVTGPGDALARLGLRPSGRAVLAVEPVDGVAGPDAVASPGPGPARAGT